MVGTTSYCGAGGPTLMLRLTCAYAGAAKAATASNSDSDKFRMTSVWFMVRSFVLNGPMFALYPGLLRAPAHTMKGTERNALHRANQSNRAVGFQPGDLGVGFLQQIAQDFLGVLAE